MRTLRRLHLYLGCFFAPLLVFYVSTGCYQTLNPERNKVAGEKGGLLFNLRSVHVDQIYPNAASQSYSPKFFRLLVAIMAISLLLTSALGIVLAFRSSRSQWPVWLSLTLGIGVPILVLWLGQNR